MVDRGRRFTGTFYETPGIRGFIVKVDRRELVTAYIDGGRFYQNTSPCGTWMFATAYVRERHLGSVMDGVPLEMKKKLLVDRCAELGVACMINECFGRDVAFRFAQKFHSQIAQERQKNENWSFWEPEVFEGILQLRGLA